MLGPSFKHQRRNNMAQQPYREKIIDSEKINEKRNNATKSKTLAGDVAKKSNNFINFNPVEVVK